MPVPSPCAFAAHSSSSRARIVPTERRRRGAEPELAIGGGEYAFASPPAFALE